MALSLESISLVQEEQLKETTKPFGVSIGGIKSALKKHIGRNGPKWENKKVLCLFLNQKERKENMGKKKNQQVNTLPNKEVKKGGVWETKFSLSRATPSWG